MQISRKAQACRQSPMRRFHADHIAAQKMGKTIYSLNIGQPDIATPAAFFHAVRQYQDPVLRYAPSPGHPELVEAIRDYYENLGVSYESEDILITNGGSEALQILMLCILDEGSEVIVPEPFYPNYHTFIQGAGGRIRPLPASAEDSYHFTDLERLEKQINPHTRAILFTNPGNPTGAVLSEAELRLLADVAKKHGLYLIGDEVYREFVYQGAPSPTIGAFTDVEENTVVIDSVSKRFSACGARVGALITKNRELREQALKFCQGRLAAPTLDQIAAAALYRIDRCYFKESCAEYQARRDIVYNKLVQIPGVYCQKPQGAFYIMARLPVDDTQKFQRWLLREFDSRKETVIFAPGEGFYATPGMGRNEVRIAYVLEPSLLERAIDILAEGIQDYNAKANHGLAGSCSHK